MIKLTFRKATQLDMPKLKQIMNASTRLLQNDYLSEEQIEASFELMGIDSQLIQDGTYLAVESENTIVGCGGWSYRKTLYGNNKTVGRDAKLLDPATDAARIRAMYTDPNWARQGIGRLIISTCEKQASQKGFSRAELMATLAGEPLYRACGYLPIEHLEVSTFSGIKIPLIRFEKTLLS